jgi:hypothetical protein
MRSLPCKLKWLKYVYGGRMNNSQKVSNAHKVRVSIEICTRAHQTLSLQPINQRGMTWRPRPRPASMRFDEARSWRAATKCVRRVTDELGRAKASDALAAWNPFSCSSWSSHSARSWSVSRWGRKISAGRWLLNVSCACTLSAAERGRIRGDTRHIVYRPQTKNKTRLIRNVTPDQRVLLSFVNSHSLEPSSA